MLRGLRCPHCSSLVLQISLNTRHSSCQVLQGLHSSCQVLRGLLRFSLMLRCPHCSSLVSQTFLNTRHSSCQVLQGLHSSCQMLRGLHRSSQMLRCPHSLMSLSLVNFCQISPTSYSLNSSSLVMLLPTTSPTPSKTIIPSPGPTSFPTHPQASPEYLLLTKINNTVKSI